MAVRADITESIGWYAHEAKTLDITVTDANGDPVDLTTLDLSWRVLKEAGSSTAYLAKTSDINVGGTDNNVAEITIDPDTDYASLAAGVHYHELWSVTDNLLLSYGDCWILPSSGPA